MKEEIESSVKNNLAGVRSLKLAVIRLIETPISSNPLLKRRYAAYRSRSLVQYAAEKIIPSLRYSD